MNEFFEIWNCPNLLEFECPQKWDTLEPTDNRNTRYCQVCSQNVYQCSTPQEFTQHAKSGRCVAIVNQLVHKPERTIMVVGRPSQEVVRAMQREDQLISKFVAWWKQILITEPSFFPKFIQRSRDEGYIAGKEIALELLEYEQFDRVLEIAKSHRTSEGFLKRIVERLVSMGQLEIALEVATIFEINNYRVISLNYIATEFARLGQIERAISIFEMSLQTARSLSRSSQKYEAEVFHCAALAGITLGI